MPDSRTFISLTETLARAMASRRFHRQKKYQQNTYQGSIKVTAVKKLGLALLALVFVLIGAILICPFFVDWNAQKGRITA